MARFLEWFIGWFVLPRCVALGRARRATVSKQDPCQAPNALNQQEFFSVRLSEGSSRWKEI
jgi:hypothetical protein